MRAPSPAVGPVNAGMPVDLRRHPLLYPGPWLRRPARLTPTGVHGLDGGAAPGPGGNRVAVAGVGSNACPEVLRAKLFRDDDPPGAHVPLLPGWVEGLRIAHAAFVSRPGFVPAAPAVTPGETAGVVLAWLDPGQLARLDATEPNYDRLPLSPHQTVIVRGADRTRRAVPDVHVYASRWGVLDDGNGPVRLTTQTRLARWLAARALEPWRSRPARVAAGLLATDARLRDAVRDDLVRRGLAGPATGTGRCR